MITQQNPYIETYRLYLTTTIKQPGTRHHSLTDPRYLPQI